MGGGVERAAVSLGDGARDREAEAGVLLAGVDLLGAVAEEPIEDALDVLGRDAGPVVADADDRVVAGPAHRDLDGRARWREAARVVEEVVEHLAEAIGGRFDRDRRLAVDGQDDARPLAGALAHQPDEIGELARALEELTNRVDAHLRFTERFAADVSHELRNPLASIRASAETLAIAERAEDRARFHARIATDIARLETLIAGVREVTRVDAGLEAEERRPIDLVGLVRERAAEGTGVVLAVETEAPVAVEASADRLGQVLDNLLDNARSFSPAGAPVEVVVSRAGDDAIVRVRDHGPGIPAEHAERIFDRFFSHRPAQVDARQKHAGLGLSIARAIAERHGGTLDAATHPGGGAVFELTLPLVRG
jgi:signal transduction histidine kinase